MPRPHFFRTEKEGEGPAGMEGMGRSKSAESAQEHSVRPRINRSPRSG